MTRPYAMLRAGFPYLKTVGMRRLSVNFPVDVAVGRNDALYILCRNEEGVMVRMLTQDDEDLGSLRLPRHRETGSYAGRWPSSATATEISSSRTRHAIGFRSSAPRGSFWGSGGSSAQRPVS